MADTIIQEGVEIPDLGMYEDLQIQPLNSWDLTKTTFIIPLRCETPDRIRNITTSLVYLLKNFDTQVIVKEHDKESIFLKEVVPMLDQVVPPIKMHNIHHIFEETEDFVFHRTKIINDMLMLVETPVVCNYDADILLPMNTYIQAQNVILNGYKDEEIKVVYPYGYGEFQYQLFMDDNDATRFVNSNFNFGAFQGKANSYDAKFGFCQFFDTKEYIKFGAENEGFIAYGYEDDERYHRFNTCSKVLRINEPVFHMEHGRTKNSWFNNEHIENNRSLWLKLSKMTRKQLVDYYSNPDYMTVRGVKDGVKDGGQE